MRCCACCRMPAPLASVHPGALDDTGAATLAAHLLGHPMTAADTAAALGWK